MNFNMQVHVSGWIHWFNKYLLPSSSGKPPGGRNKHSGVLGPAPISLPWLPTADSLHHFPIALELVAPNRPWWEHLCYGNWQTLQRWVFQGAFTSAPLYAIDKASDVLSVKDKRKMSWKHLEGELNLVRRGHWRLPFWGQVQMSPPLKGLYIQPT